jgi:hypothetical protein
MRTRPRRETMMLRVADPLLRRRVALDSPSENPSGENVKVRAGPASDTRESEGPLCDQSGVVYPRAWMLRVVGSTVNTRTRLPVIAISRARVCAAAIWPAVAATSMRSSAPVRDGSAIPRSSPTSASPITISTSEKPDRMHQCRGIPAFSGTNFGPSGAATPEPPARFP